MASATRCSAAGEPGHRRGGRDTLTESCRRARWCRSPARIRLLWPTPCPRVPRGERRRAVASRMPGLGPTATLTRPVRHPVTPAASVCGITTAPVFPCDGWSALRRSATGIQGGRPRRRALTRSIAFWTPARSPRPTHGHPGSPGCQDHGDSPDHHLLGTWSRHLGRPRGPGASRGSKVRPGITPRQDSPSVGKDATTAAQPHRRAVSNGSSCSRPVMIELRAGATTGGR